MLCDNCNKNEATIHYTEVVNGVKNERHLCSECMQELDYGIDGEFPFSKLIRGILSAHLGNNGQEVNEPLMQIKCNRCGMTYNEFTKIGKFGCGECYSVFGPLIMENIKKIQGHATHTGKKYKKFVDKENKEINEQYGDISITKKEKLKKTLSDMEEIQIMEEQLREAIKVEDYEEAARLRDAIKLVRKRG